jgi:hypothetical protein
MVIYFPSHALSDVASKYGHEESTGFPGSVEKNIRSPVPPASSSLLPHERKWLGAWVTSCTCNDYTRNKAGILQGLREAYWGKPLQSPKFSATPWGRISQAEGLCSFSLVHLI